MDFHRPRIRALVEAGADLLACETIPSPVEAQALARLLEEFPEAYAWITFTGRDETHVSEGQLFGDCVQELADHPRVAAIGINCTSPAYIPSLIGEARRFTAKPIVVYPNSGETYVAAKNNWDGKPVLRSFGEQAHLWYEAGARLIGGCCRTTPDDIRVIAGWARDPRNAEMTRTP